MTDAYDEEIDCVAKPHSPRSPGRPTFATTDKVAADRFDHASRTITLSADRHAPLWRQLAEQLELIIRNGDVAAKSRIPSEEALVSRFGVSRTVVRNALDSLAGRGLIIKLPRKGIFVGEPQPETGFITTNLAAYDDLVARGHKVTATNFECYRTPPNADERLRLQLEEDATVVRIGRIFWMDGKPISQAHISFHGEKLPGLEDHDLNNRPLLRFIEQEYGRKLVRAERWFKATLAPQDVAKNMNVSESTPMIWVESVAYEADNSPLEHYRAYYNSEIALVHLAVTQ